MPVLERLRLFAATCLCAAFLAVYGYALLRDREIGWPVSIYPMFSEGRTHEPLLIYRVFGVSTGPDGESEHRIYDRELRPLDALRLWDGLRKMPTGNQTQALRYVLASTPQYSAIRLYREEWQFGGAQLLGRKLLVEVSR